jgi:F420-0:gamma-glutamyl ligase
MAKWSVESVATQVFKVGQNFSEFVIQHLKEQDLEGRVLAITSKVISIAENRLVPKDSITREELIYQTADRYLGEGGYHHHLTLMNGLLIPSAGIDESNSDDGSYILYPKDPFSSAKTVWKLLRTHFKLQNFGLILTDSHSQILRRGVTGIALAHWGFRATKDCVGQADLFGRPLKFTHVNVVDSLAAMAVLAMGEAAEQTPMAVISGGPLEFTEDTKSSEIIVSPENDLYAPLFFNGLKPFAKGRLASS